MSPTLRSRSPRDPKCSKAPLPGLRPRPQLGRRRFAHMNTHVRGWALLVAVGALACSTTSFKSTWRDPTAQPITLRGQKVAASMMSSNESTRRAGEDILAREISARGVQGIPGYQLTGGEPMRDSEALRQKLDQAGVQGTVIMRVVDRRQEVNYVP